MLPVPETVSDAFHHGVAPESPNGGSLAGQQSYGPSLRVLIVSDVRFFREGLSEALPHLSGIAVVATAEDGDQALARALALNPDVILLDTGLPDGLGIVASLAGAVPAIPVIALAVAETEHAILTWVEAGVAGYVHRSASIIELIDTVMLATRGEQACSTKVAGAMLRRLHQLAATGRQERYSTTETTEARLTPREREVAQLVADGLSNKLIAQRLNIEVGTVKCHIHNMLDKLKFHRRSDLALWVCQRAPDPEALLSVAGRQSVGNELNPS